METSSHLLPSGRGRGVDSGLGPVPCPLWVGESRSDTGCLKLPQAAPNRTFSRHRSAGTTHRNKFPLNSVCKGVHWDRSVLSGLQTEMVVFPLFPVYNREKDHEKECHISLE